MPLGEIPPPTAGGILSTSVRQTLKDGEIPTTLIECPHATACAGCPLIHLDYVAQLAHKRARVVGVASHYPALELVYVRPVEPGDPIVGYRTRAKLIVSPTGAIGLYGRSGNHEVVDIPSCRVLAPALAEIATVLRRLVVDPPADARPLLLPFDPLAGGVLRAVDLREVRAPSDSGDRVGVLATFVLQRDRSAARDELAAAARAVRLLLPGCVGIAANFHEAEAPQILGPETVVLDGAPQAHDRIGAVFHIASYGSFVQAHRDQATRVHGMVVREIANLDPSFGRTIPPPGSAPRTTRVLDLYGGSGAISLALAHAKNDVLMVESFPPATSAARTAADAQNLGRLTVRTGDVAEVAGQLVAAGERFDAVVMNPPRRGVAPAAREAVALLGAPLCIYVSCDPDTLARDLDHFARLGYAAGELVPLDMIPLTEEVETVAVLRRAPPPPPKVVYEDDEVLIVDKGAHEPVEPHPEYSGSLMGRCARLGDGVGSDLVPIYRLDPGTSGLCMLAKTATSVGPWAEALAKSGRLVYVAAAKGVTPAKGAITRDLREGGRVYSARTRYRRLAVASGHSILRVIPDGGRPHQVRRHLAAIGHPILGDERYGHVPTNRYFEEKHGLDRTFLHLLRIEVQHPTTGARMLFESTLSGDLRASLERATGTGILRFLEQKHALGENRTSSFPPPPNSDDAPPSSRISVLPDDIDASRDAEPPLSIPPGSFATPFQIATTDDASRAEEPAPRTIRHPIVTPPDED